MLQLTKTSEIDFPTSLTGTITLFVLMEDLTQQMVGLTRDIGNTMTSKILVFYNVKLTSDEELLADHKQALISIDSKQPSEVFKKGLTIGSAIVSYFPDPISQFGLSRGYYGVTYSDSKISVSDYIVEMSKQTSSLRGVRQDAIELRLKARGNVGHNAFYSWNLSRS